MRGTVEDSIDYCSKDDTKAGEYITNYVPKKRKIDMTMDDEYCIQYDELFQWGKSLVDMVDDTIPDRLDRRIFWIWSQAGQMKKKKKPPAQPAVTGTPVTVSADAARPADVHVQITPPPASPRGQGAVVTKLKELDLEQYASAIFDEGYDSMASLQGLTKDEAGEIADGIKMKPGHKRRFVDGIAN